jgi:hypothetical protein
MGINPMNKITIIIRILFAVTLFQQALQELLEMGHIRPSSSPFASIVVLVKKEDGTMRMCINYRALKKKTFKNCYLIPKINKLIDELHGAVYLSNTDLRSRYHHIPIKEEDIHKTTFGITTGTMNF